MVSLNSNVFHVKTASNWFPLVISYKPEVINTGCSLGAMGCFRFASNASNAYTSMQS